MIWIVILMALGPTNVYAETCDNITFELPDHWVDVFEGGDKFTVFDLEATKELLQQLDCGEYHLGMRKVEKEQLESEIKKVDLLETTITLYEEKQGILEGENTRLYEMWSLENKKRHEAENKVDYSWLGWTAAAILATTTLSFGVAFGLK